MNNSVINSNVITPTDSSATKGEATIQYRIKDSNIRPFVFANESGINKDDINGLDANVDDITFTTVCGYSAGILNRVRGLYDKNYPVLIKIRDSLFVADSYEASKNSIEWKIVGGGLIYGESNSEGYWPIVGYDNYGGLNKIIALTSGTTAKYFVYVDEPCVDTSRYRDPVLQNQSPTSVKPYQPFDISFKLTVSFYMFHLLANGAEVDGEKYYCVWKKETRTIEPYSYFLRFYKGNIKRTGNRITEANSVVYANPSAGINSEYEIPGLEIKIESTDWDDKHAEIRSNGGSYKIYAGQEVGDSFLSAYKLVSVKSNEYKTVVTTIHSVLDRSCMSNTILSNDDNTFDFDYSYNGYACHFGSEENLIFLAEGEDAFANITSPTFAVHDEFYASSIDPVGQGYLTYEDGTVISLWDISYNSKPYTDSSTEDGHIIEKEDEISVTYHFDTKYFGNIEVNRQVEISGYNPEYVEKAVLTDAKKDFVFGDLIGFGDDARIHLYNHDGKEVDYYTSAGALKLANEAFGAFGSVFNYDSAKKYGLFSDGKINIGLSIGNTKVVDENGDDIKISFSYASDLVFTKPNSLSNVYVTPDYDKWDTSEVQVTCTYHDNNGNTPIVTSNIAVSNVSITSLDTVDGSADEGYCRFSVKASYLNQDLESANYLYAHWTLIKPSRLVLSSSVDGIKYWDNGKDKFHTPSMSIALYNNDGSKYDGSFTLSYYLDETGAEELTNDSVISSSNGSKIYVKVNEFPEIISSYDIVFKKDYVSSIDLANSEFKTFILGNRPSKYKRLNNLCVKMASQEDSDDRTDNFTSYSFVSDDIVMSPSEIKIIVNKGMVEERTLSIPLTSINFQNPSKGTLSLQSNGFQTIYTNESDSINVVGKITGEIKYEDSEYVQEVDTYRKTGIDTSSYNVSCDKISQDYIYNGTSAVSVDMDADGEVNTTLKFSAKSVFGINVEPIEIPISIVEITEVTGISLISAKTSYKYGETFLGSDDDVSKVYIYYRSAANVSKKREVLLREAPSFLNISPIPGTRLSKLNDAMTVTVSAATNINASVSYTIGIEPSTTTSTTTTTRLVPIKIADDSPIIIGGVSAAGKYVLINSDDKINGKIPFVSAKVYGYLDLGNVSDEINAKLVLLNDYVPEIDGDSNVTITFPCYNEANSAYIDHCHFGHLFGNNNAKNRLFLSGNKEHKNMDWHSGPVNDGGLDENGNFTYFEDNSNIAYGQTDNEVVGYDIISTDQMVVIKSKSMVEPTVYYLTSTLMQATDGAGTKKFDVNGANLYMEKFGRETGNSYGAGALSNKSIVNLNGETLFISSNNEVDGLDITGQVGNSRRVANTKSFYIDPVLKKKDLSKAILFTDNTYLYLSTGNEVYVAHYQAKNADDGQYEWFPTDIAGASTMAVIGGKTVFGTEDGRVCVMDNGFYSDVEKTFIPVGASQLYVDSPNDDKVLVSSAIMSVIEDGDMFHVRNGALNDSYIYEGMATMSNTRTSRSDLFINAERNVIEVSGDYEDVISRLPTVDGSELFIRVEAGEKSSFDLSNNIVALTLEYCEDDVDTNSYRIIEKDTGKPVDLSKIYSAVLCRKLDGEYEICDIDRKECSFRLLDNGRHVDLMKINGKSTFLSFPAEIRKYKTVESFYITAPNTFGDLMHDKTIWAWTLTNDTNFPSSVEICLATNESDYQKMVPMSILNKQGVGYDYKEFSYEDLNYSKMDIPAKTTYYRPLLVPFICFGFRSLEPENSVLSKMQVIYTVPSASYGSR